MEASSYEPLACEDAKTPGLESDERLAPLSIIEELLHHMRLAGPLIFTHLMDYLPGMTNIVLVAQFQGPEVDANVTAVALSTMFLNLTSISLGMGLCSAVGILSAQAYGAGNMKLFNAYIHAAGLGMLMTMLPVAWLNWKAESILTYLGHDAAIAGKAASFTRISTIGLPFFFSFEIVRKLLQAHSTVDAMAVISLASNVIHVGAGYYLTHETSCGFTGPAIGRVVANMSLLVFVAVYFHFKPTYKAWDLHWTPRLAATHLAEFFHFGMPGAIILWVEFGSFEILSMLATRLSNPREQTRVTTVLSHLLSVMYMIYFGISTASMVRVGNMIGANRPHAAKTIMRISFGLVTICLACTITTIASLRETIAGAFFADSGVIHSAKKLLLYILPLHALSSYNSNAQGVLRGMGQPGVAAFINAACICCIGLPLSAMLGIQQDQGLSGLWLGFTVGSAASFVLFSVVLASADWHKQAADAAKARRL
ncbi:unnamed protein product [Aphanomyces euteiches]|uniref:MATE efflux family protein n=1 Tax=Aphanomyces euteiches TaxID=100861 RepID=A0A6G0XN36_9STRA|nr:hypothetical protein Ae201684_003376 [Aphanomyces euteiches]KAH9156903.1 hypothetical protein AeRB84_001245 [Aphanomyces euteiches]